MSPTSATAPPPDTDSDLDKPERRPWLTVAADTMATQQRQASPGEIRSPTDWMGDAARQAGYSLNAFRRQLRVAQFLQSKVTPERWQALLRANPSFSIMELMQRYFEAEPAAAEALMADALDGRVLYRDLLARYQGAQAAAGGGSGRKVYANRSQGFKQHAIERICKHSELFISEDDRQTWSVRFERSLPRFPYGKPDLVAIGRPDPREARYVEPFVDTFEVRLFGQDDSKQVVVRTLERVAMLQMFFRKVWLVYPSSDPAVKAHELHLEDLRKHLDALEMRRVGIVTLAERSVDVVPAIVLQPTWSDEPERASILWQLIE